MAIPFDQIPIGEGLDPTGQPGASFFIDRAELDMIERDGPEWKFHDARFIDEAVGSPDAIFEGLSRANQTESLCYSVRLTFDPEEPEESQSPPRYGYVFLVFVRVGVGGYVVFDWEWREEDPDEPGHPVSWETDFARRAWQRT
jgi:hypothetical protein